MTIDDKLLTELCGSTLDETNFEGIGTRHVGKVRDSYVRGDQRIIVVSDRVSCFDVVVGTIPERAPWGLFVVRKRVLWVARPSTAVAVASPFAGRGAHRTP